MTTERTPRQPSPGRARPVPWPGVRAALLALAVVAPGCEHEVPPGTTRKGMEPSALPANVSKAAKKALPGVTFSDVWMNVDTSTKALHSYEVRGRQSNGKIREVRISPSGEVLEME